MTRLGYRDHPNSSATLSPEWTPFSIYPHWNARGVATSGSLASGAWTRWYDMSLSSTGCPPINDLTGRRCLTLQWPFGHGSFDLQKGYALQFRSWHGSLLTQKRDGSGLEYKRNRQYDPQTGRFTQQDPIGLAGGMNLYGYAGGDPVNNSDPFGLCPEDKGGDGKTETLADCPRGSDGWREHRVELQREQDVRECVASNRFSALFGGGFVSDAVAVAEAASLVSIGTDLLAMLRKGKGALGTTNPYASGFNMIGRGAVRAVGRPDLIGTVNAIGGKVTPTLAVVGAFTGAYNTAIKLQCRAGVIQ